MRLNKAPVYVKYHSGACASLEYCMETRLRKGMFIHKLEKAKPVCSGIATSLLVLCLISLLFTSCGQQEIIVALPPDPMPEATGLRIAVASDTHFNPKIKESASENGVVFYNPELIDALLYDAREQGAQMLLLTGDICNNGIYGHHEELAEKLQKAEERGLSVYVLPGNHDLGPIGQQDFANLYTDFGYGEAYSRDEASLSYCILREDICLLMMDTAGYLPEAIDLPGALYETDSSAFFSEETLCWAEQMLALAQERELPVLCTGHYNLLTADANNPELSDYYLENGDRFASLMRTYQVPLYLSGYLHSRMVLQEEGLTELVTEYLLSYPTSYSMLDLTEGSITYVPRRVNVEAWAKANGVNDSVLLSYSQWQEDELRQYSYENVDYMAERNPLKRWERNQAADFFYAAMRAYWNGTIAEKGRELKGMPGYASFFRCAKGFSYGWWLKNLIENASPLLAGFRLEYFTSFQ